MISPTAIKLWRQMSELTAPECASVCRVPHSCCSLEYCEMAQESALTQGVVLTPLEDTRLPFLGPAGCIVEPHLRPLCTLHTCAINSLGCKPDDPQWTRRYFHLRARLDRQMMREK